MAQAQDFQEEQQEVMSSNDPAYEAWFRRKVEAGEMAYREGRIISQEEAARRAELRREKLLKLVGR
ncbi:MAG: hypothetical protein IJU37_12615 [Desulfovibrio sp.]|nr:hypothetical protein [Desulfovibrio sp.]